MRASHLSLEGTFICAWTRTKRRWRLNPDWGVCLLLPLPAPKKQSISTLEREWDTQRAELGTRPSWGGLRSVVRTRHQPGRSLGRSNSSTVWPGGEEQTDGHHGQPERTSRHAGDRTVPLTGADGHLRAASCREVVKHHRQLATARELPRQTGMWWEFALF